MNIAIVVATLLTGGTAVAMFLLLRTLASPHRFQAVSTEWLARFSISRYRPMERLFSEEDFRFLAAQEGCRSSVARRLRRERARVFRSYLNCLRADFGRLEAAVAMYMAACTRDRPDLAKALLKRRLVFAYAVAAAELRLVLYRFGLGTVDVHSLVVSLDGMRLHLGQMALSRQASLA